MLFQKIDEEYLTRVIGRNEVILFLGSGFSRNAENKLRAPFPTGVDLSKKIWDFLKYSGPYDQTPLPDMFRALNGAGIKNSLKEDFLNSNLLSGNVPDIYDSLVEPLWYKIYTVNIDDVLTKIYRRNKKPIQELIYPDHEYRERDQLLETTQIIYLHGKLPCDTSCIIFSNKDYATASLKDQPLYSQFVYEYATMPTLFVGTELNEPLFEKYIESRRGRNGYAERRPKSYLITPSLSPAKKEIYKNEYNIHHVEGTTEDFLNWLKTIIPLLPSRDVVLKNTFPSYVDLTHMGDLSGAPRKSIYEFSQAFRVVPREYKIKNERSAYLLGANPQWNDIFRDFDIPRTITKEVTHNVIEAYKTTGPHNKLPLFAISGSAGSGKSTIIKRLGLTLAQQGITVFMTDSEYIPKISDIKDVISTIDNKVVIIFDNAKNVFSFTNDFATYFSDLKNLPIIIYAIRSNQIGKLEARINTDTITYNLTRIPDLDSQEISLLIDKLEEHNLLGRLKGLGADARFAEFNIRAKKQILVAMKETTSGKSFDEIIEDEFNGITPYEAQLLCLCVALCTEQGVANTKQEFLSFAECPYEEALEYLNKTLSGTIMPVGDNKILIRHKVIADHFISHCADYKALKTSYIRVLSALSPQLKLYSNSIRFPLYRRLINHMDLYHRFQNDINMAREIYDSIQVYFDNDANFWLQYGSLELEGRDGDLVFAENYINQAESISPGFSFIQNAKCSLYYKQSVAANSLSKGKEYKEKADELADNLLSTSGKDDFHLYHIHSLGTYEFINKWVKDINEKKIQLEVLKRFSSRAIDRFPMDKKLKQVDEMIVKAYLYLGSNRLTE